ncbi:MAG: hypothetical protein BMS9Abin28_1661 [Anaerolineae bacterium]|nr:MAG: hypothetical protein BMS9Abin28_1661 [Anaerolineae bacterium]
MRRLLTVLIVAVIILGVTLTAGAAAGVSSVALALSPTPPPQFPARDPTFPDDEGGFIAGVTTGPTAIQLAAAMEVQAGWIVSASFNGSDPQGAGIGDSPLGIHFPTKGGTFAILSTGNAQSADAPNSSSSTSAVLSGLNNSQGNDLMQLDLTLQVPAGVNCLSFDFAFYSEEFPEFVGFSYNDAFIAEKGDSTFTIVGNQVIAPLNFAFDNAGNIIDVNTVFGVTANTSSTYDGKTPLLRARTDVSANTQVRIVISIQDLGDSIFDSAVFLDNFFWSADATCGGGALPDSDGDGLLDEWEENGFDSDGDGTIDVDLPAMGANPLKPDIFIEIDYMRKNTGTCILGFCLTDHSHKPKPAAIRKVVQAFEDAPVLNPDGSTGITLHVDYGSNSVMNPANGDKWGALSQSDVLTHDDDLGATVGNSYQWGEFQGLKDNNFAAARLPIFHYVIFAHNLGGKDGTSGISRNGDAGAAFADGASDFIVSLGSWTNQVGTTNQQAGTLMHELGHNLGLRHGGIDHVNRKPNYLSVMNYSFQTQGLYKDGQEGRFDYSRFTLPELDERVGGAGLNESVGLNGGAAVDSYGTRYFCALNDERLVTNANSGIDWNCDTDTSDTVTGRNIHIGFTNSQDPVLRLLRSQSDWDKLIYTGGAVGQAGATLVLPTETIASDEITDEVDSLIFKPYQVSISGVPGATINVKDAGTSTFSYIVSNDGSNSDTYTITAASSGPGWADLGSVPSNMTLASGESQVINVSVNHPAGADGRELLEILVVSQGDPGIEDTIQTEIIAVYAIYLPLISR